MATIYEVSETGPDWEPRANTKWYAQNKETRAYAFGPNPYAALAALRLKEAEMKAAILSGDILERKG